MIVNKGDFVPACGLCCTVWRAGEVRPCAQACVLGWGVDAGGSGVLSRVKSPIREDSLEWGGWNTTWGLGQWPERQMSLVG